MLIGAYVGAAIGSGEFGFSQSAEARELPRLPSEGTAHACVTGMPLEQRSGSTLRHW